MAVICQPNRLNSMPMAISLTIGLAIRKLRVTPMGTPAATNPMNAGTALHEQNGVITPSPAAMTLPQAFAFAAEQGPGAFDAHVGTQDADDEDDRDQQQRVLDGVVDEEVQRPGEPRIRGHPEPVVEHRVPQPPVHPVRRDPGRGRGGQGEELAALGGGDTFGDAHRGTGAAVTVPGSAACKRSSASGARA